MFNKNIYLIMKKFTIPFFLLLLLGCSKENVTEKSDPRLEGMRMTQSKEVYNEAARQRGTENFSASFEIMEVKRSGDLLKITVGHAYACKGGFEVIWDGQVMESFPYQIRLFIKFNAKCTTEPTITLMVMENLEIDLAKLINDKGVLENSVIHVSNASSIQDVYSDEPVSN
jgi:hypothetical protein